MKNLVRRVLGKVIGAPTPLKETYGSLSKGDEEGIGVAIKMAASSPGPIVEIGVLFGHTTNLIATLARADRSIIAVDNFRWNPFGLSPRAHREFLQRSLNYVITHRRTQLVDMDSKAFFETFSGERPSMVFIDADHSYEGVKADIQAAIAMAIPVIAGHDFSDQHPGVKKAVLEAFGSEVLVYDTVWVATIEKAI